MFFEKPIRLWYANRDIERHTSPYQCIPRHRHQGLHAYLHTISMILRGFFQKAMRFWYANREIERYTNHYQGIPGHRRQGLYAYLHTRIMILQCFYHKPIRFCIQIEISKGIPSITSAYQNIAARGYMHTCIRKP